MTTLYNRIHPNSGGAIGSVTLDTPGLEVDFSAQSSCLGAYGYYKGRYYFEVVIDAVGSGLTIGVGDLGTSMATEPGGAGNNAYGYRSSGYKYSSGTATSYGATYTTGDIIGVAVEIYTGKIWFSKNGVWQDSGVPASGTNEAFSGLSGTFYPFAYSTASGGGVTFRFNSGSFTYSTPNTFSTMDDANEFYTYAVRPYSSYPEPDCGTWYQHPSNTLSLSYARMGGHDNVNSSDYSYFEKMGPLYIGDDFTIIEALMNFDGENTSTTTVNLELSLNANVSPVSPSIYADAVALAETTATVTWASVPAFSADVMQASPDIATCLTELIAMTGWASGNDVMFIAKDDSSTNDANRYFDAVRQLVTGGGIEDQNHLLVHCSPASLGTGSLIWDENKVYKNKYLNVTNRGKTVESGYSATTQHPAFLYLGKKFGKFYVEFTVEHNSRGDGSYLAFGLVNTAFEIDDIRGTANSWFYNGNGTLYTEAVASSSWGSTCYEVGAVVGVAVNLYTGKLWFSKNGVWQASGSPSTDANPAVSGLTSGDIYFLATSLYCNSGVGDKVTVSTGDDCLYTAPTGFVDWSADVLDNYTIDGNPTANYNQGSRINLTSSAFALSDDLYVGEYSSALWDSSFAFPAVHLVNDSTILEAKFRRLISGGYNTNDPITLFSFDTDPTPTVPINFADYYSKSQTTQLKYTITQLVVDPSTTPVPWWAFPELKRILQPIISDTDWAFKNQLQVFDQSDAACPATSARLTSGTYSYVGSPLDEQTTMFIRSRQKLPAQNSNYAQIHEDLQRYKESFTVHTSHSIATSNRASVGIYGSVGKDTGKFYFEAKVEDFGGTGVVTVGIKDIEATDLDTAPGAEGTVDAWGYRSDGLKKCRNDAAASYGSAWGTSDPIIGVAVDLDTGKIWFSLNGTWQASGDPAAGTNEACTSVQGLQFPCVFFPDAGSTVKFNFSPTDFAYTAPIGFEHIMSEDTGSFFTVAVPQVYTENDDSIQCQWDDSGTLTRAGAHYVGRAAGSIAQNMAVLFDKVYIESASIVSSTLVVTAASAQSNTACNLQIGIEETVDAHPALEYSVVAAKTWTASPVLWSSVPAFSSGVQYEAPSIQSLIHTAKGLAGWESGNRLYLSIRDNTSTDLARRQLVNPTDITSLSSINYILIEQTFGSVNHIVGREDNFAVQDAVDAYIEWDAVVSDNFSVDDSETDAPYPAYGYPIEVASFGDEVDAMVLSGIAADGAGFGDEVDAIVLDGHAEDDVGMGDVVDAFTLSPIVPDRADFKDTVDAEVLSVFDVGDYQHLHEVEGLDFTVIDVAPAMTFSAIIPCPQLATAWGMVATNSIPAPVGVVNMYIDNEIAVNGSIPAPVGTGNIYTAVQMTANLSIAAPVGVCTMYSAPVLRLATTIPAPVVTATAGVEPQITVDESIPAPAGTVNISMERTFGVLQYTRC